MLDDGIAEGDVDAAIGEGQPAGVGADEIRLDAQLPADAARNHQAAEIVVDAGDAIALPRRRDRPASPGTADVEQPPPLAVGQAQFRDGIGREAVARGMEHRAAGGALHLAHEGMERRRRRCCAVVEREVLGAFVLVEGAGDGDMHRLAVVQHQHRYAAAHGEAMSLLAGQPVARARETRAVVRTDQRRRYFGAHGQVCSRASLASWMKFSCRRAGMALM